MKRLESTYHLILLKTIPPNVLTNNHNFILVKLPQAEMIILILI